MPSTRDADGLPRRDYVVLPLLSLATILFLLIVSEAGARVFWPQAEEDSCLIRSSVGLRFRPNCTSILKAAEGSWTTDRYNECGYRTTSPCGPKPAGTLRVVLLGSSTTHGLFIPYEQTFAAQMGNSVARDLKRPVQIENLGVPGLFSPLECYRRLNEAIGLEPDAVVFSVAPDDLENRMDPGQLAQRDDPAPHFTRPAIIRDRTAWQRLHMLLLQETSVQVAQHYLFQNTDTFLRIYLAYGDKGGFLRQPFPPGWEARFADLQTLVDEMAERLRSRGIPLVLVALPSRVEAALLMPQRRRPRVDAFAFGNRIQRMAEESGATYIDLMHPFSQLPRPEDLYFVVNSHLTGEGQGEVARQLTPAVERILIARLGASHGETE
jgi:hypothetical protein